MRVEHLLPSRAFPTPRHEEGAFAGLRNPDRRRLEVDALRLVACGPEKRERVPKDGKTALPDAEDVLHDDGGALQRDSEHHRVKVKTVPHVVAPRLVVQVAVPLTGWSRDEKIDLSGFIS